MKKLMRKFSCKQCGYTFKVDKEQPKPTGCPGCITRNPDGYYVSKDKPDTVAEVGKVNQDTLIEELRNADELVKSTREAQSKTFIKLSKDCEHHHLSGSGAMTLKIHRCHRYASGRPCALGWCPLLNGAEIQNF